MIHARFAPDIGHQTKCRIAIIITAITVPLSNDVGSIQRQPMMWAGTPVTRDMNRVVPENGETMVLNPHTPTKVRPITQSRMPSDSGGKTALRAMTTMIG